MRTHRHSFGMWPGALGAVACVLAAVPALAQEAMYTPAATMPSPGVVIVRPQLNFYQYGSDPSGTVDSTQRLESLTSIQIGLARALSFTVEVPVELERRIGPSGAVDHDHGVEDIDLMFKYRILKEDSGGIDTVRAAIMAGAEVASGDDRDFSSLSFNPHIGAVLTVVRGRHGFNVAVDYLFTTGGDDRHAIGGGAGTSDAFFHNASYLYRIEPDAFTSASTGAWYLTAELNGVYETNGDYELRWAPGLMYEGRDFALELMAQFPLYNHLRSRAELDFTIGIGVRFTF